MSEKEWNIFDFSKCEDLTAEARVGWTEMLNGKQNSHNGISGDHGKWRDDRVAQHV